MRALVLVSTLALLPACEGAGAGDSSAESTGTGSTGSGGPTAGETDAPATDSGETDAAGSTSGGADSTSGDASSDGGDSSGEPPMGEPVTVAVGYGGMRVRSLDHGQTWQDYVQEIPNGGDDMDLLRGAAWGDGRFVAVGWRIFSSADGASWTEHDNPTGQWYGAIAYGNDLFVAVGGGGYCARSSDGTTWEACTDATDDGGFTHVRSVLFHDGLFWTADANGVLRSSPEGMVWSVEDPDFGTAWAAVVDGAIVPMDESAPADFATKRLRGNGSSIERASPGGDDWTQVFAIPDGNNVFQAYRFAFAEGWVR